MMVYPRFSSKPPPAALTLRSESTAGRAFEQSVDKEADKVGTDLFPPLLHDIDGPVRTDKRAGNVARRCFDNAAVGEVTEVSLDTTFLDVIDHSPSDQPQMALDLAVGKDQVGFGDHEVDLRVDRILARPQDIQFICPRQRRGGVDNKDIDVRYSRGRRQQQ